MTSFKQFFTEVSKKDVMGGLKSISELNPDYFKPAMKFKMGVELDFLDDDEDDIDEIGYNEEDALSGELVDKMPPKSTPLKTPHFYLGPEGAGDAIWIYSTHPTVFKFYKNMEDGIHNSKIMEEFHFLIYAAYREAVGKEIVNTEIKMYGFMEFDYDGMIVNTEKYPRPRNLLPNTVKVADDAYMKTGQQPDYRRTHPYVFITNENLLNVLINLDTSSPIFGQFINQLYATLEINDEDEPKLP